MTNKDAKIKVLPILKSSVNACFYKPIIFVPFLTTAFIQLLIIEILYFAPRPPLVNFFGPVIRKLAGEPFLHYPFSFAIIPRWFQSVQIPVFLFISSFMVGAAVLIIAAVYNDQKITFGKALRQALPHYVYIVVGAVITFGIFVGLDGLYGLVVQRAQRIQSVAGKYYILKMAVLYAAPYINVVIGVFTTALFAFVTPLIVLEKKRIFAALIHNFRVLWGSCWHVLWVVALPMVLYLPVVVLRSGLPPKVFLVFPGMRTMVLIVSVLIMVLIDAIVYTGITTYYLTKRESK